MDQKLSVRFSLGNKVISSNFCLALSSAPYTVILYTVVIMNVVTFLSLFSFASSFFLFLFTKYAANLVTM
jgi:hypothetical protein